MEKNNDKPRPGSKEAIAAGCKCPVMDNSYGKGYMGIPGIYVYSANCKLHDEFFPERKEDESDN